MSTGTLWSAQDEARNVLQLFGQSGLSVRLRSEEPLLWSQALSGLSYIPVMYSSAMIDYQLEYWAGNGSIIDLSVIISHDNRPCGIWPLSISKTVSGIVLGSNGYEILPPLFVPRLAKRKIRNLVGQCLECAKTVAGNYQIAAWMSAESFIDDFGLSDWHDRASRYGAEISLQHELYLDLAPDLTDIKRTLRKSYKSLISSGAKLWKVSMNSQKCPAVWEGFRNLHANVAGRVTRSFESWEIQHNALSSGDAFLVCLHDQDNKLIGGGFFQTTRDEGLYAVGAYDRSLFDKPLGHVVQYRAIEEMKRRGVRWYKIGSRPYPSDNPRPSDKELAIADFKQGFASHIFPRYILKHSAG